MWSDRRGSPRRPGAVARYRDAFFDRNTAGVDALVTADTVAPGDPSGDFVAEHFARPGAATAVDAALRLDTTVMPTAKERGLFRPEAVDRVLADPNGRLNPLRGNELWQLALLELWLQRYGITGAAA